MTPEDYAITQQRLLLVAGLLAELDLDAFLEATEKAEILGPIVDPTLFRAGADNLQAVKRLAVKTRELAREVHRQRAQETRRPLDVAEDGDG